MPHYLGDSVADAAARWLTSGGFSHGARDARRWDLRVVAQRAADGLGRPQSTPAPPAYLRELRRLGWADLDPHLLATAMAEWGLDHAPASQRRIVATWSSFLRWCRDQGYPVPGAEAASLMPQELESGASSDLAGEVVAAAIRGGRRTRDAWPQRDQAMVGVIVAGGLSLASVSMLRLTDLKGEHDRTRLESRSRQGTVKVVELPSAVRKAIDEYLASRQAAGLARSAPDLFVACSGKPYTPESLRYLYVGWFRRAGLTVPRDAPRDALRPVYLEILQGFLRAPERGGLRDPSAPSPLA